MAVRSRAGRLEARSFWLGAGLGGALAASLAAAAIVLYPTPSVDRGHTVPALTMALNETRDVSLAIDSAAALGSVQIRVVLAGGIELANFGGRNSVTWNTDLNAGINRLTLPVVALDAAGGDVLVEVRRGTKRQVFLVHVDVDGSDLVAFMEPKTGSSV